MVPSIQAPHLVELISKDRTSMEGQRLLRLNSRIFNCDMGNNPSMDPLKCDDFSLVTSSLGLAYGHNILQVIITFKNVP